MNDNKEEEGKWCPRAATGEEAEESCPMKSFYVGGKLCLKQWISTRKLQILPMHNVDAQFVASIRMAMNFKTGSHNNSFKFCPLAGDHSLYRAYEAKLVEIKVEANMKYYKQSKQS
jgi:hypothetical protein